MRHDVPHFAKASWGRRGSRFGILAILFIFLPFLCPPFVRAWDVATQSSSLAASVHVQARPRDFMFNFTSNVTTATVGPDTEIEYTITYGSYLIYGTEMTIEANWTQGVDPDNPLYSYNVIQYVAGSATKDYWGESTPLVDTVNRKIIWRIRRFPVNTIDKTLKFKLKTPGVYVTDKNVNFTVTAKMKTPEIELTPITLEHTYAPGDFIRKEIKGLQLLVAEVRRITDQSFSLFIVTSVPTRTTIYYGLTPDMDKTFTDNELSDQKLITIDGLLPATAYYYRIMIENEKLIQRKTPEIFTVTTAATSLISLIDQDKMIISANGVLLRGLQGLGDGTSFVVPVAVPVEVYIPFVTSVKSTVSLSLVNRRVLGIATDTPVNTSGQNVRLLETGNRIYSGSITAPQSVGAYDVMLSAVTADGTENRDLLTTMIVSDPILVTDTDGKPIENALVYLEKYNEETKLYEYFPAESFAAHNPAFTDSDGTVDMVLPEGQYTVNVNAVWFRPVQKNIVFRTYGREPYPKITLAAAPFSVASFFTYYKEVIADTWKFYNNSIDTLATSYRFLDLSLLLGIALLSLLSLFLNLNRIAVTMEGLFIYTEKLIRRFFYREKPHTLLTCFVVNSETGLPIVHATVLLTEKNKKAIVARDMTNMFGEFHIRLAPGVTYELYVKKERYIQGKWTVGTDDLFEQPLPFQLTPYPKRELPDIIVFSGTMIRIALHAISDTFLFAVGILNLFLLIRLGWRMLPITLITAINALLWLEYHWARFRKGRGGV